ncbi:DNA cytosine methyltransferase (plasmid) [Clostridium perfringens]
MIKSKVISILNKVKVIKKRTLNTKGNRIYLQDSELAQTVFEPGKKYSCEFVSKSNSVLKIYIDDKGKRTVSKRKRKNFINPIIDIRTTNILEGFKAYNKLEVEIYENDIIIRGISLSNSEVSDSQEKCKVLDIKTKFKNKKELRISKQSINELFMKKASGGTIGIGYEQLSFDTMFSNIQADSINISTNYNVKSVEQKTEDIKTALRLVSLCSGAGVLDKGFIDQGFEPKLSIELEKDMVETYKANLGEHVVQADLSQYDLSKIPDAEVLVAGTPCQDFSNANRVTGKVLDSPKNLLVRKVIEVAKSMPSLKVFVIENVPQLLTKGKKFVEEIKESLFDFEITINKVNSADYGSAQKRERAIIIGSKIGKIGLKKPVLRLYKTVRQAFEGLHDGIPNQLDYSKSKPDTMKRMSFVPQGGNFKDIPEEYRGKGTHSNSYRRLAWDEPSITIANPRKSNLMPPEGNRMLSVRECARLFDLPDTFIFKGTLANKQQMIANAVPLSLSTAIAKIIKEAFEFYDAQCIEKELLGI